MHLTCGWAALTMQSTHVFARATPTPPPLPTRNRCVCRSSKAARDAATSQPAAARDSAHLLSSTTSASSTTTTAAALTRRQSLALAAALLLPTGCRAAAAVPPPLQHLEQQQPQQLQHTLCLANVQADYDRYAPSYDQLDGGAASSALGFPELRQALLQQASGSVLEVGVGTGLNLPMYRWSNITSLTGVDLSAGMLQEAALRVDNNLPGLALLPANTKTWPPQPQTATTSSDAGAGVDGSSGSGSLNSGDVGSSSTSSSSSRVPVRLVQADVSRLPFPDSSFDVVADTFSLCVFPDPQSALCEMLRVLRPGGTLLLLEHTRSDNPLLGAYQGATRSLVTPLSKGCDWGQDVPSLLVAAAAAATKDGSEGGRGGGGVVLVEQQQQRLLAGTLVSIRATKRVAAAG